jgi:hypothetical protein
MRQGPGRGLPSDTFIERWAAALEKGELTVSQEFLHLLRPGSNSSRTLADQDILFNVKRQFICAAALWSALLAIHCSVHALAAFYLIPDILRKVLSQVVAMAEGRSSFYKQATMKL